MDPEQRHHAAKIGGYERVAGLDAAGRAQMNELARNRSKAKLLDDIRRQVTAEMGDLTDDERDREVERRRKLHFHRLSLLAVKARQAAQAIEAAGGAA